MGLLSSIAAALSQGVGNGMVASAKWGIEEEAQAKREAAENARLDKQMERYDKQMASQEKMSKDEMTFRSSEAKTQREWEAEQKRLDREAELARARSVRSGSNADELRGLRFVDSKISEFDSQIASLAKSMSEEVDPARQKAMADQIDTLRALRQNFITNPSTISIMDSSGSFGKAYKAALFIDKPENSGTEEKTVSVPDSLKAPPRPVIPERANSDAQPQQSPSQAFSNPNLYNGTAASLYQRDDSPENNRLGLGGLANSMTSSYYRAQEQQAQRGRY